MFLGYLEIRVGNQNAKNIIQLSSRLNPRVSKLKIEIESLSESKNVVIITAPPKSTDEKIGLMAIYL